MPKKTLERRNGICRSRGSSREVRAAPQIPKKTLGTQEQHLEKSRWCQGSRRSSADAGENSRDAGMSSGEVGAAPGRSARLYGCQRNSGDAGMTSGEVAAAPWMSVQLRGCRRKLRRRWSNFRRSRNSSRDAGADSPAQSQILEITDGD